MLQAGFICTADTVFQEFRLIESDAARPRACTTQECALTVSQKRVETGIMRPPPERWRRARRGDEGPEVPLGEGQLSQVGRGSARLLHGHEIVVVQKLVHTSSLNNMLSGGSRSGGEDNPRVPNLKAD